MNFTSRKGRTQKMKNCPRGDRGFWSWDSECSKCSGNWECESKTAYKLSYAFLNIVKIIPEVAVHEQWQNFIDWNENELVYDPDAENTWFIPDYDPETFDPDTYDWEAHPPEGFETCGDLQNNNVEIFEAIALEIYNKHSHLFHLLDDRTQATLSGYESLLKRYVGQTSHNIKAIYNADMEFVYFCGTLSTAMMGDYTPFNLLSADADSPKKLLKLRGQVMREKKRAEAKSMPDLDQPKKYTKQLPAWIDKNKKSRIIRLANLQLFEIYNYLLLKKLPPTASLKLADQNRELLKKADKVNRANAKELVVQEKDGIQKYPQLVEFHKDDIAYYSGFSMKMINSCLKKMIKAKIIYKLKDERESIPAIYAIGVIHKNANFPANSVPFLSEKNKARLMKI